MEESVVLLAAELARTLLAVHRIVLLRHAVNAELVLGDNSSSLRNSETPELVAVEQLKISTANQARTTR